MTRKVALPIALLENDLGPKRKRTGKHEAPEAGVAAIDGAFL